MDVELTSELLIVTGRAMERDVVVKSRAKTGRKRTRKNDDSERTTAVQVCHFVEKGLKACIVP